MLPLALALDGGKPLHERRERHDKVRLRAEVDVGGLELFARGQKPVRIIGPVPEIAGEIAASHRDFWRREG